MRGPHMNAMFALAQDVMSAAESGAANAPGGASSKKVKTSGGGAAKQVKTSARPAAGDREWIAVAPEPPERAGQADSSDSSMLAGGLKMGEMLQDKTDNNMMFGGLMAGGIVLSGLAAALAHGDAPLKQPATPQQPPAAPAASRPASDAAAAGPAVQVRACLFSVFCFLFYVFGFRVLGTSALTPLPALHASWPQGVRCDVRRECCRVMNGALPPSSASLGLTDYSQVDMLGV